MIDIVQSSLIFFVCFLCHSIGHRLLLRNNRRSLHLLLVYAVGLALCAGTVVTHTYFIRFDDPFPLPLSSIVWFTILSLFMVVLYVPTVLGGNQAPTDAMIGALKKAPLSEGELRNRFSERVLIDGRISDMEAHGLITRESARIRLTQKGIVCGRIVSLLEQVTGLSAGG